MAGIMREGAGIASGPRSRIPALGGRGNVRAAQAGQEDVEVVDIHEEIVIVVRLRGANQRTLLLESERAPLGADCLGQYTGSSFGGG